MVITKFQNRLDELFSTRKQGILSVFYTAGFPRLDDTVRIARELEQAGADMIEIGIPFSDPIADGPVIQHSNTIAVGNGITLSTIFRQVEVIRNTVQLPIVLMGYLNPVIQFGMELFVSECSRTGVDGVILPDLPLDEYLARYQELFGQHRVYLSFLITPTTPPDRIRLLDEFSSGFIYAVAASGTTGARALFSADQLTYFQQLKDINLKNPFLIGFGISNQATFREACRYGAGAIVGSAFIQALSENKQIDKYIKSMRS
ncbi:MAG: tryptophan synthase subunit alpha [Flammeovirgaceae bacterium]|nr:MAG: tryptophan synthase subunit alpha [Flammeovirgaceae bacterium]